MILLRVKLSNFYWANALIYVSLLSLPLFRPSALVFAAAPQQRQLPADWPGRPLMHCVSRSVQLEPLNDLRDAINNGFKFSLDGEAC